MAIQEEFLDSADIFDNADIGIDSDSLQNIIDNEYVVNNNIGSETPLQQFNDYWDDVNKWYQ